MSQKSVQQAIEGDMLLDLFGRLRQICAWSEYVRFHQMPGFHFGISGMKLARLRKETGRIRRIPE
jgi:hypothetical protein